jgi:hypothetical protein
MMVGLWKYSLRGTVLSSEGTWVSAAYRKRGIALSMWREAMGGGHIARVRVNVVSDKGLTLIHSLQRLYPDVEWVVCEDGGRKLRILAA